MSDAAPPSDPARGAVEIRPIRRADGPDWDALWRAYLAFYETSLPEADRRRAFERLLSDDPNEFHGLIAARAGRPIGLAHYLFHRHGWRAERVVYLQDLFVSPEARGAGVGEALVRAVYAAADAAGSPRVYWLTQSFNAPARALYDRVATVTPFIKYERGAVDPPEGADGDPA